MNFNSCANLSNFDLARQFYNWAHFFLTDMDDLLENLSAEEIAALEKTLDGEESRFCEKQEWMEKQARMQPVIREKLEMPKDSLRFCPITKHSNETEKVKEEKPKTRKMGKKKKKQFSPSNSSVANDEYVVHTWWHDLHHTGEKQASELLYADDTLL